MGQRSGRLVLLGFLTGLAAEVVSRVLWAVAAVGILGFLAVGFLQGEWGSAIAFGIVGVTAALVLWKGRRYIA
jgi:hypothetical protein